MVKIDIFHTIYIGLARNIYRHEYYRSILVCCPVLKLHSLYIFL